jgi:ABC-type glycerol-3-phosphate transport system substrate-binding protein
MGQGKRDSQMRDSGNFAFIALVIISLLLAIMAGLYSCGSTAQTLPQEEEKIWIHMSDGDSLELVSDEYGDQYLKQYTYGRNYIYIPYPGETEEELDTLHFYQAKNK